MNQQTRLASTGETRLLPDPISPVRTEVRLQANRHLWFQADYGISYAGKFVKESQPGRNLNYWALWAGYKF